MRVAARSNPDKHTLERGQSLILVALAMLCILAIIGLAIDTGLIMNGRRQLIAVTDGAALAAAGALTSDPTVSDETRQVHARERAGQYATLNSFNPATSGNSLTIDFPVSTPVAKKVQVEASKPVDLAFMRVFGMDQVTVTSGSRIAEAAPLDVVVVQDVSASQREITHCNEDTNYLIKTTLRGSLSPCGSSMNDTSKVRPGFPYNPTKATSDMTNTTWPPAAGWNIPWMPFNRQQDAARYFVDHLDARYDKVGLVSFSDDSEAPYTGLNNARIHQQLTSNFNIVKNAIGFSPTTTGLVGVHGLEPAGKTDMAAGILQGINVLTNTSYARANAVGAMILLSDGAPTNYLNGDQVSGCSSSSPGPCTPARQAVKTQVEAAATRGIMIYTIFVGTSADEQQHGLTLQWIADLTDNRKLDGNYSSPSNFPYGYSPPLSPSPTENYFRAYTDEELLTAYNTILKKIYTRLVQ